MAASAKRRRMQDLLDFLPSAHKAEWEQDLHKMRLAGHALFTHLQSLWALGKLSSKDFCVACHHADEACVLGAPFGQFGMGPNHQSGKFQLKLDGLVPTHNEFEYVSLPSGKRKQDNKPFKISLVYESLADEIRRDPNILTTVQNTHWPQCYYANRAVSDPGGNGVVVPLALYTDGVRYQSPLHCNTDSVVGFWLVNVTTQKRHLICSVRCNSLCTCGCRGWCSTWLILECIRWQFKILEDGLRPRFRFDGSAADGHHPIARLRAKHGAALGFRAAVLWLKGDWSDANKTHGIPSVSSNNGPCPYCKCTQHCMHLFYPEVQPDDLPWEKVQPGEYEQQCRASEICVRVTTTDQRNAIMGSAAYKKGAREWGYTMTADLHVANVQLSAGDVLVPSRSLNRVKDFFECQLPVSIVFWRFRYDADRAREGHVIHRSPLMGADTGIEPCSHCAIDVMHTLCYGPIQRWTSSVLWRIIFANPWGVRATTKTNRLEMCCKKLNDDMLTWQVRNHIPQSERLWEINMAMLGGEPDAATVDS
eukprot:2935389-Pyramimonas_sp.AAC.1